MRRTVLALAPLLVGCLLGGCSDDPQPKFADPPATPVPS
jgi:hypothetical protein